MHMKGTWSERSEGQKSYKLYMCLWLVRPRHKSELNERDRCHQHVALLCIVVFRAKRGIQ